MYYFNLKKFKDDDCVARLIKVFGSIHRIYSDLNVDDAKLYEEKIIECVKSEKLMAQVKQTTFHNIGMRYYLKDNFEKAHLYYQKAWEFSKSMSTLLYYCACSSRLDYPIEIDLKEEINSSSALAPFLYFYQFKQQKYEEKNLEDYILNEMMRALKKEKYRLPMWDMFDFEMRKLTKTTHNYKKYHLYLELQDKTIK